MKKRITMKKILSFLSLAGIVGTFILASFLTQLVKMYEGYRGVNISFDILVFLWVSMIPLVILLYELYRISKFLDNNSGFEIRTIKSIQVVKVCAAIEFVWYIFGLIKYRKLEVFIVLMGTAIVYVFAALVKEVLVEGRRYYEDSKLSI